MEPRIFDEVAADDVAGDEEVAQMFGEDHEKGGHDHHDGAEIKAGRIKGRDGKPFFRGHIGEIDNAHDDGKDISRDDADKNRNNGNKSAAQYGGENGDDEGKHGNHDSHGICHTLCSREPDILIASGASSRPIMATMEPMAAGGNSTSIHDVPIFFTRSARIMKDRPKQMNPLCASA